MIQAGFPEAEAVPRFDEVRIENTNKCAYSCHFCPRESLSRPLGVMPLADLQLVLDRVGHFEGGVDLHGFGEPLLDPKLPERARLVRARWPSARLRIITTLGVKVSRQYLRELVENLSSIEVSFYGSNPISYREMHGSGTFDIAKQNLEVLGELTESTVGAKIIVRTGLETDRPNHGTFVTSIVSRPQQTEAPRRAHNFGRGRSYNEPGRSECSVTWGYRRRVLQVTWDLFVIPCCFDFNADIRFGNLRDESLDAIFKGDAYRRFVVLHRAGRLDDLPPCRACEGCNRP